MTHPIPTSRRYPDPQHAQDLERLGDEITELAAHIHAATFQLLELIQIFDEEQGWGGFGVNSCAHWLNWKCGMNQGAAREKVRVAHALPGLPLISAAFRAGRISYSKVRAMTRVATAKNEEFLLSIARNGTANHVERLVSQYRWLKRNQALEQENLRHAQRELSWHLDDDGMWVFKGRFTAEQGALISRVLEAAMDELFVESENEPPDVSAETSRRMACDASVVHWHETSDGEPLNIGRKSRSIPPAIRRALRRRDGGCRFPGCTCSRFVDAHHVQHWADGGETKMDNLVLLCRRHHRLVHEGGFGVHAHGAGEFSFSYPSYVGDKRFMPPGPDIRFRGNVVVLRRANRENGLDIDSNTLPCTWTGERMDHDLAILGLESLE